MYACFCVCIKKLVHHRTNIVLVYNKLLIGPEKVSDYFWGGYLHPSKRNAPRILTPKFL